MTADRMIEAGPRDVAIPTVDGWALRGWHWARPDPRGVVIVAHGFGEHGACYRPLAEALGEALEVEVLAPDLRGHGRSPGRRGVVARYDDFLLDLRAALDWVARERPGLPRFVLGHSNGGLLALLLALDGTGEVDGLILSNPSLRIAVRVPPLKLWVARMLLRYAPNVTLSGKIAPEQMTSDREQWRARAVDTLRHSRISAPLYFGMAAGGTAIEAAAEQIRAPLLLLLGGADPVIDPGFSRLLFDRLGSPDKTLIVYPGMVHEPLNEIGREQVVGDVVIWLRERVGPRRMPGADGNRG